MKPVSNMAFYCCGVRMQDATQDNSLCGDTYAKLFMNEYGQRIYDQFKQETVCNASIIVRHRIIDDLVRQMLLDQPDLCIVTIGAGFDSRPYRLRGGTWLELDEPAIIAFKNERLPVIECANPLRRIPIDFCADLLEEKLAQVPHGGPIVFILEGIFIYLNAKESKKILKIFSHLFPRHQVICDLVDRPMVESYGQGLHAIVKKMGACFKAIDQPESIFSFSHYQARQIISVLERSVDLGVSQISRPFLRFFCNAEIKGNAVYVFEKHSHSSRSLDANQAMKGRRALQVQS